MRPRIGPRVRGLFAVAVAAGILAACGDGAGTELGTPPTSIVQLSMPVDTVVTGDSTDPPISVRVEDALGGPVEGAPVRFLVVRGAGSLSPGVAVSDQNGVAESVFRAAGTPGESTVRVDIPSASNVAPLEFRVLVEAADSVVLRSVAGDQQRAEVGSQLARPFVIEARTTGGAPAGGVDLQWRISGGASAVLTNEASLTDLDGAAHTVLTLGRQAGDYTIEVFAGQGVYSDTVRFTATASATFDGAIVIDSISGGSLVAGADATIHGRGFSPVAAENEVRVEGTSAQVLSATGFEINVRVPDFSGLCLPQRDVGVRVLVGEDASNGPLVSLQPAETPLDLEVGEAATLRGPTAVRCLQIGPSDAPREYRMAIGSAARTADEDVSMRLSTRVPADLSGAEVSTSATRRSIDAGLEDEALSRLRPDVVVRTRALDRLVRGRILSSRATPTALRPPVIGDTLEHTFAVGSNLGAACDDVSNVVTGVVRAAGQRLALVEDVSAPPSGFTDEDWATLLQELDQIVAPVDTAYFGAPADIDGNGVVIVLFTPEVNRLSAESGIGGFFLPLDLAASGNGGGVPGSGGELCPASNEGEILYMAAADPDGDVGPVIDRARAIRNARGLVAHELQHLIGAERRVLGSAAGFAAAEEVWLDEALSGIAEEVAGLAAIGLQPGGDYTFGQVAGSRDELDAFNAFQINNFLNLSLYMLDSGAAPTIARADPGGLGGLQMRGFGWFFLRWLGDQAGGDERALYRGIVGGGPDLARGIENIERVTGRDWEELLADFAVALATDDSGIESLPDRFTISSWNFRDVFRSLNGNSAARSLFPLPFPLRATALAFETAAREFDVGASSVRYFALASGLDASGISLGVLTPSGRLLEQDTEPQITIVRTR